MQSHCIGLKKSRYLQAEAGWSGIKNQVKKKKKNWVCHDFKGRVKADSPNQTLMLTEINECFASSRNQDATLWMAINF